MNSAVRPNRSRRGFGNLRRVQRGAHDRPAACNRASVRAELLRQPGGRATGGRQGPPFAELVQPLVGKPLLILAVAPRPPGKHPEFAKMVSRGQAQQFHLGPRLTSAGDKRTDRRFPMINKRLPERRAGLAQGSLVRMDRLLSFVATAALSSGAKVANATSYEQLSITSALFARPRPPPARLWGG